MERHKQSVIGPLRAVPCPWCGEKADFRDVHGQFPLEAKIETECDHCHKMSVVVAVDNEPRIILRQKHT